MSCREAAKTRDATNDLRRIAVIPEPFLLKKDGRPVYMAICYVVSLLHTSSLRTFD